MKLLKVLFNLLLKYRQKIYCSVILFALTPSFFLFEMIVVRPKIAKLHKIGFIGHSLHVLFSGFCFFNIVGNMILSIRTKTTLDRSHDNGVYCPTCCMLRPAGSWHCNTCNACILRRDHHCVFFSTCIGLYNQRYFILYLCYMMISMIYSSYYNYCFISSMFDELGMLISIFRIMNPLFRFMVSEPMSSKDLYMFFLILNVGLCVWSTALFFFHMSNALRGLTTHESKCYCNDMTNWKENLENVFGKRWLMAMLFFFVESPLPENVKFK